MRTLWLFFLALFASAIPLVGLFGFGWSPATTLALYWCESVLGILFVASRLVIHRALTHKRGYRFPESGEAAERVDGRVAGGWTFFWSYLAGGAATTFATGFFLGLFLFAVLDDGRGVSLPDLGRGLISVGAALILALATDCVGMRERPFAWMLAVAERSMMRMALLFGVLFVGAVAFIVSGRRSVAFYGAFVLLKVALDFRFALRQARRGEPSEVEPRPLAWIAARLGPREGRSQRIAESERKRRARKLSRALAREDAKVLAAEEKRLRRAGRR